MKYLRAFLMYLIITVGASGALSCIMFIGGEPFIEALQIFIIGLGGFGFFVFLIIIGLDFVSELGYKK